MHILSSIMALSVFVTELMSQMTLEEKIGQLNLPVVTSEIVTGETLSGNVVSLIRAGQAGAVFNAAGYETVYGLQKIAVEESRLGIPLLFGLDVIHGYKTCYPVPLGLASSWNMSLVEKVGRISAIEASADGINWLYGPMLDISRDPRWGRCVESPGEDAFLNGAYGAAMVKGIQGELRSDSEILSCVKHFALYGASESGMDYRETDMSPERMYNVYLEAYREAIQAGAASVMASFNDINGTPASADEWLLNEVLRNQWGFDGFVVSDYNAIREMSVHGLGDASEVSKRAITAGVDMDMVCSYYLKTFAEAVRSGRISEEVIDRACRRILEVKYELGLFENPYKFIAPDRGSRIGTEEAVELAYKSAVESFVLLKNDGALPLKDGAKVAFVGPFVDAGAQYAGSWSAKAPKTMQSIFDVLKNRNDVDYLYARGANILDDAELEQAITFRRPYERDDRSQKEMLKEALKVAKRSDVIVACLGEGAYMSGESNCRTSLGIPDCQRVLLEELARTGKPVVLVLFSGRPLTLSWEDENLEAILDVWYGGTCAAEAIVDVLIGKQNPSGKLTMTFPRSVGQIPIYYGHKPSGRPNAEDDGFHRFRSSWIDSPTSPLYPFGYGLSYSNFEYSDVKLSRNSMSVGDAVRASVRVTNTGKMDGDEIVQLYIRDVESSMTRPVKELKGFRKVHIPAGESREVEFDITADMLSWYYVDAYNMSRSPKPLRVEKTLEEGDFEIMIGPNSAQTASALLRVEEKTHRASSVLTSPSGLNVVEFSLTEKGKPTYSVKRCGKDVVLPSTLGFELRGSVKSTCIEYGEDGRIRKTDKATCYLFDSDFELLDVQRDSLDEEWSPVWGEESRIRNHYNEMLVRLRQKGSDKLLNIRFRAYDDGIGFRYEFPSDGALRKFVIKEELTEFRLTGDHSCWWIPGDYDSQEYSYTKSRLSEISSEMPNVLKNADNRTPFSTDAVQTAFLMKTDDGLFITIHEAALKDYSCAHLVVDADRHSLQVSLTPDAQGWKGDITAPSVSPWRTIQMAEKATDLLASRLVLNLNEPCAYDDVSWIRPGKYMGVWWEMICLRKSWSAIGSKKPHAANTEYVKSYIDFASEHGIESLLVEGWNVGWEDWSSLTKEHVFDFTKPYPDFDVEQVCAYARQKGVKLVMHHETASSVRDYERQLEDAYTFMNKYGYEVVKSGYVGDIQPKGEYHFGQWMNNHYLYCVTQAAKHHIMVNAHEAVRPTGLCRTYPNLIGNESAKGTEYQFLSRSGIKPGHTAILPFTRLNGGPMDYTPGIFCMDLTGWAGRPAHVNSTICGQLGLYLTMYSPMQMAADTPEHYREHPDAFQFIKDVAVDWSESRYLYAEPMEYVVVARKAKDPGEWFCGGVTDESAREFEIRLDFLEDGKYEAQVYCDAPDADCYKNETAYTISKRKVTNKSVLKLRMAPGGGFAVRFKKLG